MYTNAKRTALKLLTRAFFIVAVPVLWAGCSTSSYNYNEEDEESTTASNDACYISQCYFSNLRIPHVVKASDGVTDSTYYTTYIPNNKYLTINQRNDTIQNRDSLAKGTDLSKVPLNILYTGSSIQWRKQDAFEEDEWNTFNSGDSLDLRQPMHIKVTAVNGGSRKYVITINMHNQDGDELEWNEIASNQELSGERPMRMAAIRTGVIALVNDGGSIATYTHGATNTGEWIMQSCPSLPANTDVMTLVSSTDALFVNTTDGKIFTSTDGNQWSLAGTREGIRLLGTSDNLLYALKDGVIENASLNPQEWGTDNGRWKKDELDDREDLLPCENMAFVYYEQNIAQNRAILIGYTPDEDNHYPLDAIVWSKAWPSLNSNIEQIILKERSEDWMMHSRTWDDLWQMPMLKNLQVVYYNDKLMAIGGENPYNTEKHLEGIYESEDNGLTWRITGNVNLPTGLGTGNSICWIVDNDNFLWLAVDGKIFRGRLNSLGFDRK